MSKCTCSLFKICDSCFKEEQELSKELEKSYAHSYKILIGEIKPNCNKCNDSGYIRCSCKECNK